jgi:hypothetical protein
VDPRAGLDYVEKKKFLALPELELRPLGHPAHRQSLSRPQNFAKELKDLIKIALFYKTLERVVVIGGKPILQV